MPVSWTEWLLELLCRIYREWGGNCADLGIQPAQAITLVIDTYSNQGMPIFADESAEEDFLANVQALQSHLALSGNTLTRRQRLEVTGLTTTLVNPPEL